MSAHKRNLRKLAFAVGVVPRDANSLHMSAEEFEAKLVGLYPDISELGDDEVTALIADAEAGGGTPVAAVQEKAPPAKAPKAKPAPAPAAEVEADPDEEEPTAPAAAPAPRRGRPPKAAAAPVPTPVETEESEESAAPSARPAARPAARAAASAAAPAASIDLSVLQNMVKDIGTKVFDYEKSFESVNGAVQANKDAVAKLSADIADIRTTLKAIGGYLTWQYNSQVDESDAVQSITKVSW